VGPARFEWGPDRYRHWFDGSGIIHKFAFAAGKVGYANRYVRGTAFVENERAGRITAQTFATDLRQELFRRGSVHYHATGNANINAITAGDILMAFGEAPLPIAIDPQTQETRSEWPWRDDILLGADGSPRAARFCWCLTHRALKRLDARLRRTSYPLASMGNLRAECVTIRRANPHSFRLGCWRRRSRSSGFQVRDN
jgi:hypothetical protein